MKHPRRYSGYALAACGLAFAASGFARRPQPAESMLAQRRCPREAPEDGATCAPPARHCVWHNHGSDDGHDRFCDCAHGDENRWRWRCTNGPEIAY